MAKYVNYTNASINILSKRAIKLGLSHQGDKDALIARIKDEENVIDDEFNTLARKYVPSTGSADTRQGKLLRMVQRLLYRYFNDGDSFAHTIEEYPEPYEELVDEDKRLLEPYLDIRMTKDKNGAYNLRMKMRIVDLLKDAVARTRNIEGQSEPEYVYILIVESLDPRTIIEIKCYKTKELLYDFVNERYPIDGDTSEDVYRKDNKGGYVNITVRKELTL